MKGKRLSRRDFLRLSTAAATGTIVAACAPSTPVVVEREVIKEVPVERPVVVEKEVAKEVIKEVPVEKVVKETVVVEKEVVKEVPAKAEKAAVSFWVEAPAEERRKVINELYRDTFNAAHSNIELELTFTEDLDRVLRTAMQAGAGPDIVSTPGAGFILEYVIAGHVAPMDDLSVQYGWRDRLLPWAYESGMVQGHLYSVPLTYESMIVYYNKTLFDEKGWGIPTDGEELDAIINACVADDIHPFVYTNSGWKPSTEHLIGMFYDHYAGADNVYKALIGEKSWADDEFVGAMTLMNDWFQKGYYSGSVDNYHALTGEDVWSMLANGQGAMMMTGTWSFQTVDEFFGESGQEWDWFPMPSLRKGVNAVYALATGQTESINAKTKHPVETGAALDWLYNDKKRALMLSSSFNFGEWMVPLRYTADDFPAGTDPRVVRFFVDFADVTGRGDYGYTTWTFWPAKTEVMLWEDFDFVLAGEMTPAEFQAQIQRQFEEEVAEGKVPPVPKRY
jgi:raffinose/stachyose/melibiose transport system substrate-binding protein